MDQAFYFGNFQALRMRLDDAPSARPSDIFFLALWFYLQQGGSSSNIFHIGDGIELSLANPTRQFMLIASRCKLIWEPLKSSIRDALCFTHFHPHYSVWGMYTVRIFTTPGHTLFLLWVYINLHVLDIYTVYAWGEENPGLLLMLLLVVATSGRKEENRNENLSETVSTTAVTISGVTHISHSGSDFRRVLSHFYCLCLVLRHHPTSPSFGIGWAPDLKRWNNR